MATAPYKPPRNKLKPDEVLCEYCTGKCCRYFALPIDKPKSQDDFEYLRWYVIHGATTIFTEDDTWYLMVHNDCDHLQADNRCGIYDIRPQICRDYTTKECEYEDDWCYENYFETDMQIVEFAEAVVKRPRGEGIRSPKPSLLPVLN